MELKTLVATVLDAVKAADLNTIYSLLMIAKEELKLKTEITMASVEYVVRQLVDEGYLVEYEESSLDLSKRWKKYIATDKIKELAQEPPQKIAQISKMRYVTPSFYYLLNYSSRGSRGS